MFILLNGGFIRPLPSEPKYVMIKTGISSLKIDFSVLPEIKNLNLALSGQN